MASVATVPPSVCREFIQQGQQSTPQNPKNDLILLSAVPDDGFAWTAPSSSFDSRNH
ncbi:hypothetical protein RvY_12779 [Ramazzottius varieornatus]|uniref:Uncharacterized protein n=1 Tax=Ramazzottius varieornatus TaxID=947166 RepID=A0A1D1VKN2_RAMVA|nr:hypothetical protein RvY_12779 [Ramazzottius varieornatus]